MSRHLTRFCTLVTLFAIVAGALPHQVKGEDPGPRRWKWVLWWTSCYYPCDPSDPGGSEHCDCFQADT